MKTNKIKQWAALLLTVSGLAAAPLTVSADYKNIASGTVIESGSSYSSVSGNSALTVQTPGSLYSGTNIHLDATTNIGNSIYAVRIINQGAVELYNSTISAAQNNGSAIMASGSSTLRLENTVISATGTMAYGLYLRGGVLATVAGGTSAVSGGSAHNSRAARMEAIRALNVRLDHVVIENLDWQKCLELYDRSETFFFIDPPYTNCHVSMYDSWTITDVQRLRDAIGRLRGKWVLTLNDLPDIRAIFADCAIQSVERQRGINNSAGAKRYRELIITPNHQGGRPA